MNIFQQKLADIIHYKEEVPMVQTPIALFKEVFPDWLSHQEWTDLGEPTNKKYLFPWQERVIEEIFLPLMTQPDMKDLQIKIALAGAYGCGKTVLLAIIILMHIHYCYTYEKEREYDGGVYSGSRDQLKQAVWKHVKRLSQNRGFFCQAERCYINADFGLFAKTWNKGNLDSTQGIHGENVLVIFDEATAICDEVFKKAETFSTKSRYIWIVTGNPLTTLCKFYEFFTHPIYSDWIGIHISAFDSHPEGHNYARNIIKRYGPDSDEARTGVFGLFPLSDAAGFFQRYHVDDAMNRPKMPCADHLRPRFGLDFSSGRGSDYSTIAIQYGNEIQEINKYKLPPLEFVNIVLSYVRMYNPKAICGDRVGLGEVPMQLILEAIRGRNIRFYPIGGGDRPKRNINVCNRRVELLTLFRDWIIDGGKLPNDQELKEELLSLVYAPQRNGKINVISKSELKKSTDKVDACMYLFADDFDEMPPDPLIQYKQLQKRLRLI